MDYPYRPRLSYERLWYDCSDGAGAGAPMDWF